MNIRILPLKRFLLVVGFLIFSAVAFRVPAQQPIAADKPQAGIRVFEVGPDTPAQRAGLKPNDVIVKFGDFAVVDTATYFVARDTLEKSRPVQATLVYWRGKERLESVVTNARLGIRFNDFGPVADELGVLLAEFTGTLYAAESGRFRIRSREKIQADAQALLDRAESNGTLTPTQILIARISLIADDAPAAETEKQMELLGQLLSNRTLGFISYLGYEALFHQKHYRPAVECFKRYLKTVPGDANFRLNMGLAYLKLGMFAEADDTANYIFNERSQLTDHGYGVAFNIRASAALGRRDFTKALEYAERAFQYETDRVDLMLIWQLAAAQNGEMTKFYEVIEAGRKAFPKDYPGDTVAVLEAYVLFKNNQIERAKQMVRRSGARDGLPSTVTYWSQFPSGDEVVRWWKDLRAEN